MENYSFLVLCNPSERTTGAWQQVWLVAQKQLWQLALRAAPPGWPGRSPDQLWTRTVLSQAQCRAWDELRLLWGQSGSGWWQRVQPLLPWTVLGDSSSFLLGDFYFTLDVSIRAWRACGSRPSLSPMVPRPMHLPVTLDFLWYCQHKSCFQKKPNKIKETPCS